VRRFTVDDLARYSPWPARLLGHSPWETRVKTPGEIEREFGVEKWGSMLERATSSESPVGLDEVNSWVTEGVERSLVSVGDDLVEMSADEAHAGYIDFIAKSLEPYLPASALVELGCGYGSVILDLARRPQFSGVRLFAADFTESGPALAALIAGTEGVRVTTGKCDLTKNPVTALDIPAGALVFTAYAAQYIESLDSAFVDGLAALDPKVVVHVEPLWEHCSTNTVLGLLRRRYIQANGYNRNLATLLHEEAARGKARLLEESPPAFGPNPLLAASVIAWAPAGTQKRTQRL
jgi:hypothetical protein